MGKVLERECEYPNRTYHKRPTVYCPEFRLSVFQTESEEVMDKPKTLGQEVAEVLLNTITFVSPVNPDNIPAGPLFVCDSCGSYDIEPEDYRDRAIKRIAQIIDEVDADRQKRIAAKE